MSQVNEFWSVHSVDEGCELLNYYSYGTNPVSPTWSRFTKSETLEWFNGMRN